MGYTLLPNVFSYLNETGKLDDSTVEVFMVKTFGSMGMESRAMPMG